jgi:hypothetical protein
VTNLARRPPVGLRVKNAESPRVRASARGEECTLRLSGCLPGTDTVVLCHVRMFGWAGMSQKPDDFLAVYACHSCHDALDRRARAAEWGFDDVLRAMGETQKRLYAKGLLKLEGDVNA